MARPFAAPPGVPAERIAQLRKAFMQAVNDPDYIAEAGKQKLDVNPVSGIAVDTLIRELYATPKDIVDETRAAIAP